MSFKGGEYEGDWCECIWDMSATSKLKFVYIGWPITVWFHLLYIPMATHLTVCDVCVTQQQNCRIIKPLHKSTPATKKSVPIHSETSRTGWRRLRCHFPGLTLKSQECHVTLAAQQVQIVLSVNRHVNICQKGLWHGEGSNRKWKEHSDVFVWNKAMQLSCTCAQI